MTRIALDSNILIYAESEPDSAKGRLSTDLILRTAQDGVIPVQVLGEYLRVIQRRLPVIFAQAIGQAAVYHEVFITPPTTANVLDTASALALGHGMHLWDCVVCAASAQAGAKVLLTEDMQDGRILDGLRLINPFLEKNAGAIAALLAR